MVEKEEEEEVFYSCQMIIVDTGYQERSIEMTHDNHTRSNTVISRYNLVENRAKLTIEIRGLHWQNVRINMSSKLAYTYPKGVLEARFLDGYNVPPFLA